MRIRVTVSSVLDTERISNKGVRYTIESSAFNKTKDSLAAIWACGEVDKQRLDKDITLELL